MTIYASPGGTEIATCCDLHPHRASTEQCHVCGRYMCSDCRAYTTFTIYGNRCTRCARQDLWKLGIFCFVVAIVGGMLFRNFRPIDFPLLIIYFAAGGFAFGEVALRFVERRRTASSAIVAAVTVIVGISVGMVIQSQFDWIAQEAYLSTIRSESDMALIRSWQPGWLVQDLLINGYLWAYRGVIAIAVYLRFQWER